MREANIEKIWPRWQVDGVLGQGTFGTVYRVCRKSFDKTFYAAVKYIHIPQNDSGVREMMSDGLSLEEISDYYKEAMRGLSDEISIMETLKGASNIVSIEDYEIEPDEDGIGWNIYIRMELLENLNSYRQHVPVTPEIAARIGIDLCTALEYCAQKNIIHRDIKPDNIFISSFGKFKLGDFGIARNLEGTCATMSQKGTSMYMAPEIFKGERYDATVDTYSLGLVLYRLVNKGRMPFMPMPPEPVRYQDMEMATNRRICGEQLPPAADADPELAWILCKAANPDPAQRYETPTAMKEDLKRWLRASKQPVLEKAPAPGGGEENRRTYEGAPGNGEETRHTYAAPPRYEREAERTVMMFPGAMPHPEPKMPGMDAPEPEQENVVPHKAVEDAQTVPKMPTEKLQPEDQANKPEKPLRPDDRAKDRKGLSLILCLSACGFSGITLLMVIVVFLVIVLF